MACVGFEIRARSKSVALVVTLCMIFVGAYEVSEVALLTNSKYHGFVQPGFESLKPWMTNASAPVSTVATDGVALVFGHNHKAGGTTVKSAFRMMVERHAGWIYDEFTFGARQWDRYVGDGRGGSNQSTGTREDWFSMPWEDREQIRLLFVDQADMFLGLCAHVPRPCIYLTTLRNPVAQHVSSFHYFCELGAEGKQMWGKRMKQIGACDVDVRDWKRHNKAIVSVGYDALANLARGDRTARAAAEMMVHPCVWVADTTDFAGDLKYLANEKLGGIWQGSWDSVGKKNQHANGAMLDFEPALDLLEDTLQEEEKLFTYYNYARPFLWQRSVVYC